MSETTFTDGDGITVRWEGDHVREERGTYREAEWDDLGRPVGFWVEVLGEQLELGTPPDSHLVFVNWDKVLWIRKDT